MLTPGKIKGYQFQQAGRGTYKADEVDEFLNQIVDSYEQVFKENGELVKKLNILATKLNDYRKEESNISKALVNAQSFIDRMVAEAEKESKKIVADAEERAKNIDSITNAKIKVMVDEVEGKMRVAYDKAMAQAKDTKDKAFKESETLILEARQKADLTLNSAKNTAALIISDATKEGEKEAEALRQEIEKEKKILDSLKETSMQFKTELVVLYERQLKNVEMMPDYMLGDELDREVKKIVEEKTLEAEEMSSQKKVEKIVEELVADEDDYFDADDLISEYSNDEKEEAELHFDYSNDEAEETEDIFNFDFEDASDEKVEAKEEVLELADEFEDIFSDSGDSEDSFRFTPENYTEDEINAVIDEVMEEAELDDDEEDEEEDLPFEFVTEDVNIFADEPSKDDIAISRPERKRKFDVAFSKKDEVEIKKDEDLILKEKDIPAKKETGFKLFDNIDISDETDVMDADDVFGKADDGSDDDTEGFSFLKNIFGKK